jgi:hypothetical protein
MIGNGCQPSRSYAARATHARGVVSHGRYAIFQMAEVLVPRELFERILGRIARLRPPDLVAC